MDLTDDDDVSETYAAHRKSQEVMLYAVLPVENVQNLNLNPKGKTWVEICC